MGRGAAATALPQRALPSLPSLPSLPVRRARSRSRAPPRSPLVHTLGVSVGAALRVGLLHHLRGAPAQDRNAVYAALHHPVAMLSVFAGHGKHGARLAELAATVMSRHVRATVFPRHPAPAADNSAPKHAPFPRHTSASLASSGSSFSLYDSRASADLSGPYALSLERVVDDAFVEANIAVDATQWSRNSGTTATVCLLRRGQLVVATCGNACVMLASRRAGRMHLQLLTERHGVDDDAEKERVERFGGLVKNGSSVSDLDERYTLPFTRSLGDLEMRSAGVCQLPTIRTFDFSARDTHVVVSSQPLWSGTSELAPQRLADCIPMDKNACPIDIAEELMKVAYGASGPTYDGTILVGRLR